MFQYRECILGNFFDAKEHLSLDEQKDLKKLFKSSSTTSLVNNFKHREKMNSFSNVFFDSVLTPSDVDQPNSDYLKVGNFADYSEPKLQEFHEFVERLVLVSVIESQQRISIRNGKFEKQFSQNEKYTWASNNKDIPFDDIFFRKTKDKISSMLHCSWGTVVTPHKSSWDKHNLAVVFPSSLAKGLIYRLSALDTMILGKIPVNDKFFIICNNEGYKQIDGLTVKFQEGQTISHENYKIHFYGKSSNIRQQVDFITSEYFTNYYRSLQTSIFHHLAQPSFDWNNIVGYNFIIFNLKSTAFLATMMGIINSYIFFPKEANKIPNKIHVRYKQVQSKEPSINIETFFNEIYEKRSIIIAKILNNSNTIDEKYAKDFWMEVGITENNKDNIDIWFIYHIGWKQYDFQNMTLALNEIEYLDRNFVDKQINQTKSKHFFISRESSLITVQKPYTTENIHFENFFFKFPLLINKHIASFYWLHDGIPITDFMFPYGIGPFDSHQLFFTYDADKIFNDYIHKFLEDRSTALAKSKIDEAIANEKTMIGIVEHKSFLPFALYSFNLHSRLNEDKILPLHSMVKQNLLKAYFYLSCYYISFMFVGNADEQTLRSIKNNTETMELFEEIISVLRTKPLNIETFKTLKSTYTKFLMSIFQN